MSGDEELKSSLRTFAEEFVASLPQQIGMIEASWVRIWREGLVSPALDELLNQVHALIGTAGSLGFEKIGSAARELQASLRSIPELRQFDTDMELLQQIEVSLQKLRRASYTDQQINLIDLAQRLNVAKTASASFEVERAGRLIYMVEDDLVQAAQLAAQVGYFGYKVETFNNLDDLEVAIRKKVPTVILMDVSFPEGKMAGYETIASLRLKYSELPPVIFVSINDRMPFRLQAVRVGGEAYFTKPVDVGTLIDVLDRLIFYEDVSPYRVLIVDDSRVEASYNATLLKKAGVVTEIVSDPLQVVDHMIGFNPDLVLLDMYMPACTGMELAMVIRQMEQFISIPIVFLSAETDKGKQIAAMGLGGDDFLTKPIEPDHLITAISSRIERYRKLRTLMNRDGLTGLLNHTTTKERLVQEVERTRRQNKPLSFAMLDLDYFKSVNDSYGHAIGDRVLKSLAHLLGQRLRSSDTIGRFGGEEFAVILPNTDEDAANEIMEELCDGFAKVRHQSEGNDFSVTFSCGIASFPAYESAEEISKAADMAMYAAKSAGRNQVICASDCEEGVFHGKLDHSFITKQLTGLSDSLVYENLLNRTNSVIMRFSRQGKITFANGFAHHFFGYSENQLIEQSVLGTIFPRTDANADHLESMIADIVRYPDRYIQIENEAFRKDGEKVWVVWSHAPLLDENGALIEILCVGNDITPRKHFEEDLTRTVSRLSALNRISQVVMNQQDFRASIATVANEVVDLFGAQHVGVSLLTEDHSALVFIGDSQDGWNESPNKDNRIMLADEPVTNQVFQSGKAYIVQDAMINPLTRGSHALLEKHGINSRIVVPLVAYGNVIGTMNIDFEQSDPHLVSADLELAETVAGTIAGAIETGSLLKAEQRQRQYFEALVLNIPTAVAMIDPESKLLSWNPAAEKLFGYTKTEAIGEVIDDLVTSEAYRQEGAEYTHAALKNGDLIHAITRRRRKDGELVDVELLAVPIYVDGVQLGSMAIYHDISELQHARREAEAANEAKSAFLATMSHEIRTPLNAVIGMTTLLLDTQLTSEQKEFAETIRFSGDSLLTIINDILDFSKIEAGRMEMEEQPFDLRECLESALDLVTSKASEKQIDLAYLIEPNVPHFIISDSTRLRQILLNLLSNSIKFTDQGEVVLTVTAENIHQTDQEAYQLHFSIRDTGIGIPADRMDRLFRSFSQVDASTTRKYGGTGLGLAISKRLAELMGGTMWVESEGIPGKGSTFHFTLVASPSTMPMPVFMHRNQPELGGRKVLIVDDNATNRYILTRQVRSWGMVPIETAYPKQALQWIREGQNFDLALLDMQMPEMDGVTLAAQIQEHLEDPDCLPLVMLTSLGLKEKDAVGVKFAAYLTKPIKPSVLYKVLLDVLGVQTMTPVPVSKSSEFVAQSEKLKPLRILLAEDLVINQKVALQILGRLGYRADVAGNGLEVLDALRRQPYDVILMDVQMPEMDGLEATRKVRSGEWMAPGKKDSFRNQPYIIAMTANAMQGDRQICMAAGMDDYLSKPIRVDELVHALGQVHLLDRSEKPADETDAAPANDELLDNKAIDLTVFKSFQLTMGGEDQNIVVSLIQDYLTEAQQMLENLQQGIAHSETEKIRRAAHSLKSSSMLFGAMRLAELCKTMELDANDHHAEHGAGLLSEIETEFSIAQEALKLKLKVLQAPKNGRSHS